MKIEEQYNRIFRFCCMKVRNLHAAEDLTQETFLRFLKNGTYRESGKQMNYLYTIAGNLCNDYYREHAQPPEELPDEIPQLPDNELQSFELREAMNTLPQEEQELLLMRYVNQEKVSDIAKLLNQSRFAVYRKTQSALEHLKEAYNGQ